MTILFGDDAIPFIREYSARLKESTRRFAEEADGREYPQYSPFLCLRPMLKEPVDSELLSIALRPGDLITNERDLALIERHLNRQARPLMEALPVAPEVWPVMVHIEAERPDAIASFREGRALLKASSFLDTLYPHLIECVVPQDREKPSGFDGGWLRGVVFRTFPEGRTGLLAGFQLAHAMGHQAAIMLQAADPLISSDPDVEIFWQVRKDRRTANHAFVSAVALGYMTVLSRAIYGDDARPLIADEHVAGYAEYLSDAVRKAVDSISSSCRLTRVGESVLEGLSKLAS